MSVLIKGMEMPEDGHIICRIYANGEVCVPTECVGVWGKVATAIPVPDHGRLIDADAAIGDVRAEILEHQMNGMKGTPFYIEDLRLMWQRLEDEELMPTIIPADKEGE